MTVTALIPAAPHRLPLFGHAVSLLRDPFAFLSSLPAYGDLVRVGLGPVTAVVVCDPGLTRHVLRHDRVFDKGGQIIERAREVAGNGLFSCPHSEHRRQRRLLQPAFRRDRLPAYADLMAGQITAVSDSWSDGQILDVLSEMRRITSGTITRTLFSSAGSEEVLRQIPEDLNTIFASIFWRTVLPMSVSRRRTFGSRAYDRAIIRLRGSVRTITAQRRGEGVDGDDLLSAILAAHGGEADGDRSLTEAEICDQITTFFGVGTDTAAAGSTWALHPLDSHPAVAEKLYAEVDTVLAGRPARHGDLPRLEYTSRVITETLRLRPPAWLFTRTVAEDTELGGHRLAAGTTVIYSPYLLHHRPDLYHDAEHFDPDRWGAGDAQPGALIPFGDGHRKCIGDEFALVLMTLALATIASRWRLSQRSPWSRRAPRPVLPRAPPPPVRDARHHKKQPRTRTGVAARRGQPPATAISRCDAGPGLPS